MAGADLSLGSQQRKKKKGKATGYLNKIKQQQNVAQVLELFFNFGVEDETILAARIDRHVLKTTC